MDEVKKLAECCICTDLFDDPRMLPCIHTFCLRCLVQTAVSAQLKPGDTMLCPLCWAHFVIPIEGMSGIKRNLFLKKLVELARISRPSSNSVIFCEVCSEDSKEEAAEQHAATQYCIQCQQHFCNRCCREHKRFKNCKDHQLVTIGSPMMEELMRKFAMQCCDWHSDEQVKLYCTDCKQAICLICFAGEHSSHKCADIERMANQFRKDINDSLQCIERQSMKTSEKIAKEEMDFQGRIVDTEKAIIKRGNELKELVDRCTKTLKNQLDSIKQQVSKQLESARIENETLIAATKSFELYCEQLVSKGSSAEICRSVHDLQGRSQSLQESQSRQNQLDISPFHIDFQPSTAVEFLDQENIVGFLKDSCLKPMTEQLDLSKISAEVVTGVTALADNIYVLTSDPNSILVFCDLNPFQFQKRIQINDITGPYDIGSSKKSGCLYVSDASNECIWRITTVGSMMTKWLAGVENPFTFSVTSDDRILIVKQVSSSYQLKLFGLDGTLCRNFQLPSEIRAPLHFIQTPDGNFIIAHRDEKTGRWTISQLSSDGQNIISQFHARDLEPKGLDNPQHLCLDAENGQLFVADYGNHRLLLLCSTSLRFKRIFAAEETEFKPLRLYFDARKKQLIVGHYDKKVDVHKFFAV